MVKELRRDCDRAVGSLWVLAYYDANDRTDFIRLLADVKWAPNTRLLLGLRTDALLVDP